MKKHVLTGKFKDECTDREDNFERFITCKIGMSKDGITVSIWVYQCEPTPEITDSADRLAISFVNDAASLQEIDFDKSLFDIHLDISSIERIEAMFATTQKISMGKETSIAFEEVCELLIAKIVEESNNKEILN